MDEREGHDHSKEGHGVGDESDGVAKRGNGHAGQRRSDDPSQVELGGVEGHGGKAIRSVARDQGGSPAGTD